MIQANASPVHIVVLMAVEEDVFPPRVHRVCSFNPTHLLLELNDVIENFSREFL